MKEHGKKCPTAYGARPVDCTCRTGSRRVNTVTPDDLCPTCRQPWSEHKGGSIALIHPGPSVRGLTF